MPSVCNTVNVTIPAVWQLFCLLFNFYCQLYFSRGQSYLTQVQLKTNNVKLTFQYNKRNNILFNDDTDNRVACVCHVLKLSNKKCVGSLITCAAETMQLWHHSENLCHSLGWERCHGAFCGSQGFCLFLFPPSFLVHLPPCVCLCPWAWRPVPAAAEICS